MSFRWWSSCITHAGKRRRNNEDAYFASPEAGVWAVADGMGGHARGDLASQMVTESLDGLPRAADINALNSDIRARLVQANERVFEHAAEAGTTMGATVAALMVAGSQWCCLWAGDSRVYRLSRGRFEQITHDHTLLQERIDAGADLASIDPRLGNRVTRALGAMARLQLDECRGTLRDGDTFLVCSDGLTKELANDELAPVLEFMDCDEAADELLRLSLARGARDNVTLAVIRFESLTETRDANSDDTAINYAMRKWHREVSVSGLS